MQNNENKNPGAFEGNFYSRMIESDASSIISERSFNMILGGSLVWGFALTYLICRFVGASLLYTVASAGSLGLILMLVAYFALTLVGNRMLYSGSTATSFLGFNIIVVPIALLLSTFVTAYTGYEVTRAAMLTAVVTVGMMAVSAAFPHVFEKLGSALLIALTMALIISFIGSIFFPTQHLMIDIIVVAIMALYVGFDWNRALTVQCTAGNALIVAASLYLDIVNIFIRLLRILRATRK